MRHRRIPVIRRLSAITPRGAAGLRQSLFELYARLDVELAERPADKD
jgi:hypothetical protein